MPKSALPKFADWTPPWGDDAENIDPEKLSKYIHGLLSDKEKHQTRIDEAEAKVTEVTAELEQARTDLNEQAAKGADEKLATATSRVTELETKLKAAESTALKLEVALDKGLTKVQAKRLIGNTVEEVSSDADELLESFGGKGAKPEDAEDDEDEDAGVPTRTPKPLVNPGDREGTSTTPLTDADIQKAVSSFGSGSFI